MVIVNHQDRSYLELGEEQIRSLAKQIGQAMTAMDQALAAVPESQRAQMQEMMKSRMPDLGVRREPSELKRTGTTDTVNGYPCVKYEVWRSGGKERELWVTDWSNIEGLAAVATVFAEMAAFMTEMLSALPKMGGQNSLGDPTFEHLNEMNGFPVKTREFGASGAVEAESLLKSSREAALSRGDFEPPKGYKRKDVMKRMGR